MNASFSTLPRIHGTSAAPHPRGAPTQAARSNQRGSRRTTCSSRWLDPAPASAPIDREALYADFAPLVGRLLRQYGDDAETRQDLSGEIYFRFMELLDVYDPSSGIPLRPYLVRQLTISIFNYSRRNWRNRKREASLDAHLEFYAARHASDPTPSWDREIMTQKVQQSLPAMVARLPERQRKVIICRYYESRSFQEIASMMGIEDPTARSLLRYGLKNLRRWVTADGLEWEPD